MSSTSAVAFFTWCPVVCPESARDFVQSLHRRVVAKTLQHAHEDAAGQRVGLADVTTAKLCEDTITIVTQRYTRTRLTIDFKTLDPFLGHYPLMRDLSALAVVGVRDNHTIFYECCSHWCTVRSAPKEHTDEPAQKLLRVDPL